MASTNDSERVLNVSFITSEKLIDDLNTFDLIRYKVNSDKATDIRYINTKEEESIYITNSKYKNIAILKDVTFSGDPIYDWPAFRSSLDILKIYAKKAALVLLSSTDPECIENFASGYNAISSEILIPSIYLSQNQDKTLTLNNITKINGLKYNPSGANITSVYVMHGIESIESGSFLNFDNIEKISYNIKKADYTIEKAGDICKVYLPSSIEHIGDKVFDNLRDADYDLFAYYANSSEIENPYLNPHKALLAAKSHYDINSTTGYIDKDVIIIADKAFANISVINDIQFRSSKKNELIDPNNSSLKILGNYVFKDCALLTSIALPTALEAIGDGIFFGCSALTEITLPTIFRNIPAYTFSGCTNLENVYLNASDDYKFKNIGDQAFNECAALEQIDFYATERIGMQAFFNCKNLRISITFPNTLKLIGDEAFKNSCISNIIFINNTELDTLGHYAFQGCTLLLTVENFPDINIIGTFGVGAFYGCDGLQSFTFSSDYNRNDIPDGMFSGCKNLTSIQIPDSVTSIGSGAFSGCTSLKAIFIPRTVTTLPINAFEGWLDYLKIVTELSEDEATSIWGWGTKRPDKAQCIFNGWVDLENDVLYTYDKTLDGWVAASSLSNQGKRVVTIQSKILGDKPVKKINKEIFKDHSNIELLIIPNTVEIIGDGAFLNCYSLESISIENGSLLHKIENGAFYGCSSLTDIIIPNMVETIGDQAFESCTSLANVTFSENSLLKSIGAAAFGGTSLTSIEIPSVVTSIGEGAFSGCSLLESITLPFVGAKAGLTSGDTYQYPFGYIFGTSDYTGSYRATQVYPGSSITNTTYGYFYIPSSLKSVIITGGNILRGAFSSCTSLTSVQIPNNITSIGGFAFAGCISLLNIVIPDSVIIVGSQAFQGCSSLTSVEIPNSVTSIGDYAFKECSSLTNITIGSGVISIGWQAFRNCDSIVSIEIPNNVKSIGGYAFYECSSLISVTFGQNSQLENIGDDAFAGCSKLTSIEIPDSITSIGEHAFHGCSLLTEVNYTGTIDEWVSIEFGNQNANPINYAKKLYINDELVTEANITTAAKINSYAFTNCNSLTSVRVGNSVKDIYSHALSDCASLTSVAISSGVTIISWGAFHDCLNLKIVCYEESSKPDGWSDSWLYNCDSAKIMWNSVLSDHKLVYTLSDNRQYASITCADLIDTSYITIPGTIEFSDQEYEVKEISENAFLNNTMIEEIDYDPDCELYRIAKKAFDGSSIQRIHIPKSVTRIDELAFHNCKNLECVVFDDYLESLLESIGVLAFAGCSKLNGTSTATIPGGTSYENVLVLPAWLLRSIGEAAFLNCYSLSLIYIPKCVENIGNYAFLYCTNLTIWCEIDPNTSKPSGWLNNWKDSTTYATGPVIIESVS